MEEQELPFGNKIIGFSSAEEMFDYLAEKEEQAEAALAELTDPQKGITWGSYALRVIAYGGDEALAIFGYIETQEEFTKEEVEAGADPEELETSLDLLRTAHARGYRYGTWYSVAAPDGEPGDAHLITLWPITEADYHHALNNGWEMPPYLAIRVQEEMKTTKETQTDEDFN